MKLEVNQDKGQRIWGASRHAISRFIEKNKFIEEGDYRTAIKQILKMMNEAVFVTYDLENNSEIFVNGSWIFVCNSCTVITVYKKKNCKWEHLIN